MSLMLRGLLIIASLAANITILRRVRRSKLQIDDAVFWVVFSTVLIILAVFPGIIYMLADLTGTKSPANLLYLIIIAVLIMKIFSMSIQISALESRLKKLAQDEALKNVKEEKADD